MHKISVVHSFNDLKNSKLRERTERAQSGRSKEYLLTINESEAGILSFEDWSHISIGFIYEIFVLAEFRNRGAGNLLLEYAESQAIHLNCKYIRLKPFPLDGHTSEQQLIDWYSRKNYKKSKEEQGIMEKILEEQEKSKK